MKAPKRVYYVEWSNLEDTERGHVKLPDSDAYFSTTVLRTALAVANAFNAADADKAYRVNFCLI